MSKWKTHLLVALGAVALTALVMSPFLSFRISSDDGTSRHLYETSILVPEWCETEAKALIAEHDSLSVEFYPIDVTQNWDSGVKVVALASGSHDQRDQAVALVQSACTGQRVVLEFGDEAAFVATELKAMRDSGVETAILSVTPGKVTLQKAENIGRSAQ